MRVHFFTELENLPSSPFLLGCAGNGNKNVLGTGGGGWENFKCWLGIQPAAASAKKFRKLSRSPIWGFYSVAVVYNAGIDRDLCLIDIGSGLIHHKAFRHSFISSQHHFDTTSFRHNVSFLKIVGLELDTDADEYGCLRKRKVSATAAVPKKSAT